MIIYNNFLFNVFGKLCDRFGESMFHGIVSQVKIGKTRFEYWSHDNKKEFAIWVGWHRPIRIKPSRSSNA